MRARDNTRLCLSGSHLLSQFRANDPPINVRCSSIAHNLHPVIVATLLLKFTKSSHLHISSRYFLFWIISKCISRVWPVSWSTHVAHDQFLWSHTSTSLCQSESRYTLKSDSKMSISIIVPGSVWTLTLEDKYILTHNRLSATSYTLKCLRFFTTKDLTADILLKITHQHHTHRQQLIHIHTQKIIFHLL